MNRIGWREIILGTITGLSILTSPAVGQMRSTADGPAARADNRGHGSLNSGPGSLNSGRDHGNGRDRGWRGVEDRLEDLREDRQDDRREDRGEHRQMDRRGERQADRRDDHRSNAGGELRGLDRADHVAGEHGREGRDHARFMQNNGQNRGEWIERYQRPERFEHTDRSDHPERSGRH